MTIDQFLDQATVPTSNPESFDVGNALRRLAAGRSRRTSSASMISAAHAGQRLSVICGWVVNSPGAAHHLDGLVQAQKQDVPVTAASGDLLDINGALAFACLLYLTGHPESAQFWWQLAAGAGLRAAAYCLHLHHSSRSESREAAHWRAQIKSPSEDPEQDTVDERFLRQLDALTLYARERGTSGAAPTEILELEIDRLAAHDGCLIIRHPDQQLAERLRDFARR
ncbi:hypothetical protein [Streptomyces sp. NPDC051561]|uniref:hypothetical protein n=1 Tax=Streptomyces sp. NPDC051561 TaxID=3365658 RepID=UPI0037BCA58D